MNAGDAPGCPRNRKNGKRSARLALLLFTAAALIGLGLRRSPKPDEFLPALLAKPETVSGSGIFSRGQLVPPVPRTLNDNQLEQTLDALRSARYESLDGVLTALNRPGGVLSLQIDGETVTARLFQPGAVWIEYTQNGAAHRAVCPEEGCRDALLSVLSELFSEF